jgi:hypothetical protein
MPVNVEDLLEELERLQSVVEAAGNAKARIGLIEKLIVLNGVDPNKTKKRRTASTNGTGYPPYCVLPEEWHRAGVNLAHKGKGLCSSHKQRLSKGTLTEEELAYWEEAMNGLGIEVSA